MKQLKVEIVERQLNLKDSNRISTNLVLRTSVISMIPVPQLVNDF